MKRRFLFNSCLDICLKYALLLANSSSPLLPLAEVLVNLSSLSINVIQALVWKKSHSPLSVNVFLTLVLMQVAHA